MDEKNKLNTENEKYKKLAESISSNPNTIYVKPKDKKYKSHVLDNKKVKSETINSSSIREKFSLGFRSLKESKLVRKIYNLFSSKQKDYDHKKKSDNINMNVLNVGILQTEILHIETVDVLNEEIIQNYIVDKLDGNDDDGIIISSLYLSDDLLLSLSIDDVSEEKKKNGIDKIIGDNVDNIDDIINSVIDDVIDNVIGDGICNNESVKHYANIYRKIDIIDDYLISNSSDSIETSIIAPPIYFDCFEEKKSINNVINYEKEDGIDFIYDTGYYNETNNSFAIESMSEMGAAGGMDAVGGMGVMGGMGTIGPLCPIGPLDVMDHLGMDHLGMDNIVMDTPILNIDHSVNESTYDLEEDPGYDMGRYGIYALSTIVLMSSVYVANNL